MPFCLVCRYPIWKSDPIYLPKNIKISYKWTLLWASDGIDICNTVVASLIRGKHRVKAFTHYSCLLYAGSVPVTHL